MTVFAAAQGNQWIVGSVREDNHGVRGGATVGRGMTAVDYSLFEAVTQPLAVAILESGNPLVDGHYFDREVTFSAQITGGSGSPEVTATIDGASHQLATPYATEGLHSIRIGKGCHP